MRGALGLVAFVVFLELAVLSGIVDVGSISRPTAIFAEMGRLLTESAFLGEVWVTVLGASIGLGLAIVFGVLLGALISSSKIASRLVLPIVEVVRPLPGVALAPLLIAVFQRGMTSRSLTVAIVCAWPIMFNTIAGFGAVDRVATETARVFGESRLGLLRRVHLPSASPFIWTGIRVAASIAIVVEIAVEILIPDGTGLGGFIATASVGGVALERVYGATLVAGVLSLILNFGLNAVDSRLFGWRRGLGG